MRFDPRKPFDAAQDKHHRRSIRLPNYDYAQPGGYFITIVTYHRDLLFGEIVNEEIQLNDFGKSLMNVGVKFPIIFHMSN
jgi:putative transposase